ncbi:uncharacterized protein A4U43_C03F8330 [Asparagus officinalis]|uniref:Protein kinase domain-containing protein n=1 Tax=Asparagus officinalis TaxID=4686 RepID=A0A5P1FB36_ASPOF|nr:uncharacterized protein A4U43_C03F8330 [Asparagus officinalis]
MAGPRSTDRSAGLDNRRNCISDRLSYLRCQSKDKNISCYSNITTNGADTDDDFLSETDVVHSTGCEFLFTTVKYETDAENVTSVVFSEAELGWWVHGKCLCSANANCTRVKTPAGGPGFRCRCGDGYQGDGFAGGSAAAVSTCGSAAYMSGNCGGSSKVGALVGGIFAGGAITAGLAVVLYLIRGRCSSSRFRKSTKRLLSDASFNVPFYPYKTIERATDNFSDTNRLGTGAYGTVYVGNLSNGDLVAVKKIKHPEPETVEQVVNEVKMISSVNHPNLVRLLGCCIERGEQILVYEFMPNGTLAQHLQRQRGVGLPWTIRLAVATETAKAIAYLHSAVQPPIYHRDIKSSNILLDHQFNAKIADFGLSRAVVTDFSHVSTAPQGTPGYVDPQYHQNYHLSDKSDVYSFGVVLMEIITGLKVVDFNRVQSEVNLAAMAVDRISKGKVEEIIDPFLGKQGDSWALASIHKVAELGFRCLAFHRDMRPSMMEVADELEQIRLSCWAPKDGDVVVPQPVELCTSPLMEGSERVESARSEGVESAGKSKRLVVSGRIEEKVNSPVSVQDNWVSEQSTPSSSSLLGYPNH